MNQVIINEYPTSVYNIIKSLLPKTSVRSTLSEIFHEWGIEYNVGNGVIPEPLTFFKLLKITYPEEIGRNRLRHVSALKGSLSYRLLDEPDPTKLKPDGFREIIFVNDTKNFKEITKDTIDGKGFIIGAMQKEKKIYFNHTDSVLKKGSSVAELMEKALPFVKDSKLASVTLFILNDIGTFETEGEKLAKVFKDKDFEFIPLK